MENRVYPRNFAAKFSMPNVILGFCFFVLPGEWVACHFLFCVTLPLWHLAFMMLMSNASENLPTSFCTVK